MRPIILLTIAITGSMISVFLRNNTSILHPATINTFLSSNYASKLEAIGKEYDIDFIYKTDNSFIDTGLLDDDLNGRAAQISGFELARYSVLLPELLSEYPEKVIKNDIKTIKLAASLTLYGVSYGGTSIDSTLYLTSSGIDNGYTDTYIKQLFHHEFSSILMRNYNFPDDEWSAINPPGFKYAQNINEILRAISQDESTSGNTLLYTNGFLSKYSMSTLENDVSMYAETLFTNPTHLASLVETYPRIRSKFILLRKFYLGIDREFKAVFDKIPIT